MLDEIRGHDPQPTDEEKLWTTTDPVRLVLKALGLAAMAIAIGVSLSELVMSEPQPRQVTMRSAR
jgi:hypothetical protein